MFVDGTFSVCRNIEFAQIYIFSVNIQNSSNTKTFSYPFMKFLMKKRSKKNYEQILRFCKKIYFQKFKTKLNISTFHCELAFIRAVKSIFQNSQILLCSVHIIRTFQKNFVNKISGNFQKNPKLLYIWKVICGAIFLNLSSVDIMASFRIFLMEQRIF